MKYGLIGETLGHSFSAEIHAMLGYYDYKLCPLPRKDFSSWMQKRDFCGINVTIPYKKEVIPFLDDLSDEARRAGAVNTVVCKDHKAKGYNTDIFGMRALLKHAGIDPAGKSVLILGTGGTAGTAKYVCASSGSMRVQQVSRTGRDGALTYEEALEQKDVQIIIQTTPCGMFPNVDDAPIDLSAFPRLEGVIDAVYNPLKTRFVQEALARGVRAEGGLFMLVAQAVKSAELFTGNPVPDDVTEDVFQRLKKSRQNLVLIGMPGCGKTTLGRLLAKRCGRAFVDSDEEIVNLAGKDIPSLFATVGEAGFRALETKVLRDLALRQNLVIATGGGAILRKENNFYLSCNGKRIFLDLAPELIGATPGRPLSKNRDDVMRLYKERYTLYRASCDERLVIGRDINENLEALWRMVQ